MQLERGDLRDRSQTLDAIDLQIGLAVAEHRDELEQIRCARHGVALEELFARDTVGRADDRAGPSLDMPIIQAPTASK